MGTRSRVHHNFVQLAFEVAYTRTRKPQYLLSVCVCVCIAYTHAYTLKLFLIKPIMHSNVQCIRYVYKYTYSSPMYSEYNLLFTPQRVEYCWPTVIGYCNQSATHPSTHQLCTTLIFTSTESISAQFRNTPQIMDTATGAGNASDAAADGRNGSGAHPDHSRTSVPAGLHVLDDRSGGTAASTHATYVITSQKFAKGSRFGPLLAKKSCVPVEPAVRFPLVIFGNLGIADDLDDCPELNELFKVRNVYLDTSQPADCNWMVHVTPAAFRNEQNLIAYQQDGSIYFMSIADIEVGDVLKVWYAPLYANKMWVPLLQDSQHQIVNNVLQQLTMDQQQQSQQLHHPMQQQQQHQHHHHHQQHQQQQHQVQHPQSNGGGGHHMANASGAAAPYPTVESVGGPPSNLQTYHQQQQQIAAAAASAASAAASASSSAQNTNNAATPSIAGTNNNNNHPNNNGRKYGFCAWQCQIRNTAARMQTRERASPHNKHVQFTHSVLHKSAHAIIQIPLFVHRHS